MNARAALSIVLAVAPVAASAQSPEALAAPTVGYRLDALLLQVDRFGQPGATALRDLAAPAAAAPRAVGLGRLRLALDAQVGDAAGATLVLRPDAVNRREEAATATTEPVREVDTRAGDTYRPMPTVRLLDAYQVHLVPGRTLSASLGVWEELAPARSSYPELLGFGLETRLPAKLSGARLRWRSAPESPAAAGGPAPATMTVDAFAVQGDEDRAEGLGGAARTDDAPVARDPYQVGALAFGYARGTTLDVGLLAVFGDASDLGGRRSDLFFQIAGSALAMNGTLKATVDLRHASERWKVPALDVAPRAQTSAATTLAFGMIPAHWALVGLRYGTSEHARAEDALAETRKYTGWQVDAGYLAELQPGLQAQLLVAHERRRLAEPGAPQRGGILGKDGEERSSLRRFAIGVSYTLGGSV